MSASGRRSVQGVVVGAGLVAVLVAILVGPYIRDDLVLDRIVKVVALDWRDFGEAAARQRLQHELDLRRIGMQVRDDDCELTQREDTRRVRCAWNIRVRLPGAEVELPLAFVSEAAVGADGDVRP